MWSVCGRPVGWLGKVSELSVGVLPLSADKATSSQVLCRSDHCVSHGGGFVGGDQYFVCMSSYCNNYSCTLQLVCVFM